MAPGFGSAAAGACAIALPLTSISSTAEHTVIRINIGLLNRQSSIANRQSPIANRQSISNLQSPINNS
jgi:hypothetical protein